jgi:exonuclease SbcD
MSALRILHFADAHIDMANFGRHDPESGLPIRVMDFLKSLDEIVNTAIDEKVDMVLFAGDAYKDRNPAPTYQREWGRRIMRLSNAGIPTLLLVGNHDLSPSLGRAHALEEFATLEVPHVQVLDEPSFLGPDQLEGLPLQVIALPWLSRSKMMARKEIKGTDPKDIYEELESLLNKLVNEYLDNADPDLPVILTAHASVQGAVFGGERTVMLGGDLVLSGSFVKDNRLDYVALGHIHKKQDLNEGNHPPVIYPGSIERVDFGEARDDKFFVIAKIDEGKTTLDWRKLKDIRPFIDLPLIKLDNEKEINQRIQNALPSAEKMKDAVLRLTLEYPRDFEALIDEAALRELTAECFEFHFVKRTKIDARVRIPEDQNVNEMSPYDLLDLYWKSSHIEDDDRESLSKLAKEIIEEQFDDDKDI